LGAGTTARSAARAWRSASCRSVRPSDLEPYRRALAEARAHREAWFPVIVENEGRRLEYRVRLQAPPTLLIAGAGHIGQALARLAVDLDFRVVVIR